MYIYIYKSIDVDWYHEFHASSASGMCPSMPSTEPQPCIRNLRIIHALDRIPKSEPSKGSEGVGGTGGSPSIGHDGMTTCLLNDLLKRSCEYGWAAWDSMSRVLLCSLIVHLCSHYLGSTPTFDHICLPRSCSSSQPMAQWCPAEAKWCKLGNFCG